MLRIYLASPYGFAESTKGFLRELKTSLENAGHQVNDPWKLGEELLVNFDELGDSSSEEKKFRMLKEINHKIGMTNHKAIDNSEVVVAALDGPDVDSGTASEIGYAFARNMTIFGYRGDLRCTGENRAAVVNLQVQYWIEESGGHIVNNIDSLLSSLNHLPARKPKTKMGKTP